jgi:hypothetical protein
VLLAAEKAQFRGRDSSSEKKSQIGGDGVWRKIESVADDIFVTMYARIGSRRTRGGEPEVLLLWQKAPAETPAADGVRPDACLSDGKPTTKPVDDLVVARRRMRHLAPLDIRPLPVMHAAAGASEDSLPPAQGERTPELALHLLAIHMSQAAAKTALR